MSYNTAPADPPPGANEGFTKGDLIIRSTDEVDFKVHSLFLSEASPIFSELLAPGKGTKMLQFSDNAEVLALMLKFIYPRTTPIITSMNLLNDAVRVANTYQLDNMKTRLREQLVLVDSPVSMYHNPFGALCVASTHGFIPEAELAAKIASGNSDFNKGEDLKRLVDATQGPAAAALVKLTGVPLVKTRVLMDVLFRFERTPMKLNSNVEALVCVNCREIFKNSSRQSPPEWQARWAIWIFDKIKDQPVLEWESFFSPSNTRQAFYQPHLSPTVYAYKKILEFQTCTCLEVIENSNNAAVLQHWLKEVYEHLKSELSSVAELEASPAGNSD